MSGDTGASIIPDWHGPRVSIRWVGGSSRRVAWVHTPKRGADVFAGLWILGGDGASEAAWFVTAMKLVAVGVVTQVVLGMWVTVY